MYCFKCNLKAQGDSDNCHQCGKPCDNDPDRYFKAGMDATAQGDYDRAIDFLGDCIELDPRHLSGRYNLGIALCLINRSEDAMNQYKSIVEQEPDFPGIYTALGQAAFGNYMQHSSLAEANRMAMLELFKKAIEQDNEDIDAYFSLANAYLALEIPEKALAWFKKALNLQDDSSAIYFGLGKSYFMMRRYREAARMITKASELSEPDDPLSEDIQEFLVELDEAGMLRHI